MCSPPSIVGLFRKLNICSRPTATSRGISWRGRARVYDSHEFNRNIGCARRSSVIQRPEGRTTETGWREEASGILRSCIAAGRGPLVPLGLLGTNASWLPSKRGRSRFGEISSRESKYGARVALREPGLSTIKQRLSASFRRNNDTSSQPRRGRPKIEKNAYDNLLSIIILGSPSSLGDDPNQFIAI